MDFWISHLNSNFREKAIEVIVNVSVFLSTLKNFWIVSSEFKFQRKSNRKEIEVIILRLFIDSEEFLDLFHLNPNFREKAIKVIINIFLSFLEEFTNLSPNFRERKDRSGSKLL